MVISPLFLNFSFKTSNLKNNEDQYLFMQIFKAFGIVLANIDNCPIELSGIKFTKFYSTEAGL